MLVSGCDAETAGKTYPPYRYRLMVEVDTPDGIRSGSSVIEVHTQVAGKYSIPSPGMVYERAKGEAVAIDLPRGQTLFALLRSVCSVDWASQALRNQLPQMTPKELLAIKGDVFETLMQRTLALRGRLDVPRWLPVAYGRKHIDKPCSGYPMLVSFRNPRDPTTIEVVDPDDLSASFGTGFKLRRVTIERTEDAVTTGILQRLNWLRDKHGGLKPTPKDSKTGERVPLAYLEKVYQITDGDFRRSEP
jgi:hypothetical protein